MTMRVLRRRGATLVPLTPYCAVEEWATLVAYFGSVRPHVEDADDFGGWYDYYQLFGGSLSYPSDWQYQAGELWLVYRAPGSASSFAAYKPGMAANYRFTVSLNVDAVTDISTTPYARSGDQWRLVALVGDADDEFWSFLTVSGAFSLKRYYATLNALSAFREWTDADAVNVSANPVYQIEANYDVALTADQIIGFFFLWTGPVPFDGDMRDFDRTMDVSAEIDIRAECMGQFSTSINPIKARNAAGGGDLVGLYCSVFAQRLGGETSGDPLPGVTVRYEAHEYNPDGTTLLNVHTYEIGPTDEAGIATQCPAAEYRWDSLVRVFVTGATAPPGYAYPSFPPGYEVTVVNVAKDYVPDFCSI